MNQLSHEDFVELGVSTPTDSLIAWTTKQLAAVQGRETPLKSRGVDAAYVSGMQDLLATVDKRHRELEELQPPSAALQAQRIREEAMDYWREVKQIAELEFGSSPDQLAKFRTGVRTGLLIANLTRELEATVAQLREHAARLAGRGVSETFIGRGTLLIQRLKDAKGALDAACRDLAAPAVQQCHDKGVLYDLTRKLVRAGRLAFLPEPRQAAAFNFNGVARKRAGAPDGRARRPDSGPSRPASP